MCAPCFAAIGAIKREMGNWKWTLIAVGYQTGLAYTVSLLINIIGNVLLYNIIPISAVIAVILITCVIILAYWSNKKNIISVKI